MCKLALCFDRIYTCSCLLCDFDFIQIYYCFPFLFVIFACILRKSAGAMILDQHRLNCLVLAAKLIYFNLILFYTKCCQHSEYFAFMIQFFLNFIIVRYFLLCINLYFKYIDDVCQPVLLCSAILPINVFTVSIIDVLELTPRTLARSRGYDCVAAE